MTTQGPNYGHVYQAPLNSPRISPFRRPEGPTSPSPLRQSTKNLSPTKVMTNATTPSQISRSSNLAIEEKATDDKNIRNFSNPPKESFRSSSRGVSQSPQFGGVLVSGNTMDRNSISKLQPAQIQDLKEAFQILDRDSDGHVGREDVADMLAQLGLSAGSTEISAFFPSISAQTATLPVYLNSLADILSALSPSSELISAFSAFDDDDSGQIDVAEFKDALLNTIPEPGVVPLTDRDLTSVMTGFVERRALQKQTGVGLGKRGEVFKYHEFVASVAGGLSNDEKNDRNNVM